MDYDKSNILIKVIKSDRYESGYIVKKNDCNMGYVQEYEFITKKEEEEYLDREFKKYINFIKDNLDKYFKEYKYFLEIGKKHMDVSDYIIKDDSC